MPISNHSIAIICLFISLIGFFTYAMKKRNTRFAFHIQTESNAKTALAVGQFLRTSLSIYSTALLASVITIIALDWRYTETHENLIRTEKRLSSLSKNIARSAAPSINTTAAPQHTTATANATTPPQPAPSQPAATLTPPTTQPTSVDTAPISTTATQQAEQTQLLYDVYNPESSDIRHDSLSHLDAMKKRYENIIVLYMFMKRCQSATQADYITIRNAMNQEASQMQAPATIVTDITNAAQGAYEEIYSRSDCNAEGMAELRNQYTRYIIALEQEISATESAPAASIP